MDTGCNRRFCIIVNPAAGRGRAMRLAEQVQCRLHDAGALCDLEQSSGPGDAERLARSAVSMHPANSQTPLCLVACGGDGTIQEIANALVNTPSTRESILNQPRPLSTPQGLLGLAPAGRCNDFASTFGIRSDANHIASILLAGHCQSVDLGHIGARLFCTVAAVGFDAAVSRFVNDMGLPLRGTWAYVYGVLRMLLRYKSIQVRLTFDGLTKDQSGLLQNACYEGPIFLAASANTPTYGGRMRIAPWAEATDGRIDLCLVSPLRRLRVVRLLRCVMRGGHADLPEVHMIRARALQLESTPPQEIWADGEFITHTPTTIGIIPNAIRLMVPSF